MRRERRTRPRRPTPAARAWLCCVLTLLAACGDGPELPPSQAQDTDSAGVSVVTNPPSDAAYAAIVREPVLSIGAVEGPDEEVFGRVASVARGGTGNFIVADGQAGEIRVFGADGDHLRTLGTVGDGPGEFQTLAGAWPTAEGVIVAADRRLRRITLFGPEGELTSTATLNWPDEPLIDPIGLAGEGAVLSLVESLNFRPPESAGSMQDALESLSDPLGAKPRYLVRHDLAGALIDTVATLPGVVTQTSAQGSGTQVMIQIMRVPFSPSPTASASPQGRVAVTDGRSYEYSVHGPAGSHERIVRLAEEPPVRTDEHLETWVRGSTGGRESMDDAQVEAAMGRYEGMPMPERLPAWNSLLIADGGEIWARRFAVRGVEAHRWDVFDADGNFLGQVVVPARFRIQHIGDGKLTVISADDLGVERVEVYELTDPGS